MDIRILKEALKCYAQSADCPAKDRDKVLEAIGECQATIDRVIAEDVDDFTFIVSTIPVMTLSDFLNLTTYNIYGKLAKRHGGRAPFHHYVHAVERDSLMINMLTAAQLQVGYDFIADLWSDNEANGEHNPDGTFKR